MVNFNQQISNFINTGEYDYMFDDVGNEILNLSSSIFQQVYFSLPLYDYSYTKILSFYNPVFTEFIPTIPTTGSSSIFPQEAIDQINSISLQNTQLENQLNSIIANSTQNSGSADIQSIKDTIISLRIQLGQGMNESDFQTIYPYLPIPLELQNPPSTQ